ncbi:lamin tail domain-containing protein [Candidatus Woesearchaeota archaeon]|nr:lamin tail domain-containing protein [Candidatus Woesearchaeota archaeon]
MKILLLVFFLFFFLDTVIADLTINEVMYNPEGNDNNKEFVELFSDNMINLTSYVVEDSGSSDVLELLSYYNGSYSLIVEEGFNYTGINASIYSVGATIGNNLNNDEDIVIIRDSNNTILDVLHYYSEWGAYGNGKSLCQIDNIWQECSKTPGLSNNADQSGADSCDWTILVILNGTVFEDPEFKIRLVKLEGEGKANLTVDKWIEDSRGNIEKTYAFWNAKDVLNYKTSSQYSPALAKGDAYFINANITGVSCEDTNLSNNFISEMIFVVSEEQSTNPNSSINILDVSPSSAEFGDIVKVKMNVYRGDTLKYAVYAYVENEDTEKVSEKSTMHFKNRFTNYTLTVPLQLKPNCDEDYGEGSHNVLVEGLDKNSTFELEIEGINEDLCEEVDGGSDNEGSGRRYSYELISTPNEVNVGEEFNSVVKINNEGSESIYFEVWSYVYRGNKCYSGDRTDNMKTILVPAGSSIDVELMNKVIEAEQGDYKLKIKIKHENLIYAKEITKDIKLFESQKIEKTSEDFGNETILIRYREPKIVYESSSYKARNKVSHFLISALAVMVLILLWRK